MDPKELEPDVPQDEIDAAAVETPTEQPEAKAEPEQQKPQTMVPHQALHEERERRKTAEREARQVREEAARRDAVLQDRLNQLYAVQNPPPQYRDPNSDSDPLQAIQHNENLTRQQLQELQQERQNEAARQHYAQQEAQLVGWAQSEAARFKSEHPEFDGAYKHMVSRRAGELQAMGWAPQQVAKILRRDEMWVYQSAAQSGQNPAELIYRMAKNTGWNPEAPKAAPVAGEQKIEQLNKGMQASKTLAQGGGQAGKPTAEQLAAMSDEEFAEFKASQDKRGMRMSDALK